MCGCLHVLYTHYVHVVLLGSITDLICRHEFNIIAIDLGLSFDGLFYYCILRFSPIILFSLYLLFFCIYLTSVLF